MVSLEADSRSPGGVMRMAGVVAIEESPEDGPLSLKPGARSLCSAASSAASFREIAEPFLLLKVNLDLGVNLARVLCSCSVRALMA
jgi:hypothetical protein